MNKVLKNLVLSDLFILSSFGLVQPLFAVFIISSIRGATISAVGIAITIQLFTKAVFQIAIAKWADEERGNCRELYTLVAGSLMISFVPLGYAMANTLAHIYLTQFFYGLGQALSFPSWRVLFTRYTDHDHQGFEWGVYDTIVSLGVAASAALGGYLAEVYSFRWLFVVVATFSFVGSMFLIHIFRQEFSCRISLKKRLHL